MNTRELKKLARDTHTSIADLVGTFDFTISGGFLRDSLNDETPKDIDCFFINASASASLFTSSSFSLSKSDLCS